MGVFFDIFLFDFDSCNSEVTFTTADCNAFIAGDNLGEVVFPLSVFNDI